MKFFHRSGFIVVMAFFLVAGCSKPESKLIGAWSNTKTESRIEFNKDHTGAIYQRTNPNIPPNIPFRWTMLGDSQFKVEVGVPGATNAPAANGRLEGKDMMILENDTFKKVKP